MTRSRVVRARLSVALLPAVFVACMAFAFGLVLLVFAVIDHGRMDAPLVLAVVLVVVQMSAPFFFGAVAFALCREFLDGSPRPLRKRWLIALTTALSGAATFLLVRSLIARAAPPVEEWAPILFFAAMGAVALRFSRVTRV